MCGAGAPVGAPAGSTLFKERQGHSEVKVRIKLLVLLWELGSEEFEVGAKRNVRPSSSVCAPFLGVHSNCSQLCSVVHWN